MRLVWSLLVFLGCEDKPAEEKQESAVAKEKAVDASPKTCSEYFELSKQVCRLDFAKNTELGCYETFLQTKTVVQKKGGENLPKVVADEPALAREACDADAGWGRALRGSVFDEPRGEHPTHGLRFVLQNPPNRRWRRCRAALQELAHRGALTRSF